VDETAAVPAVAGRGAVDGKGNISVCFCVGVLGVWRVARAGASDFYPSAGGAHALGDSISALLCMAFPVCPSDVTCGGTALLLSPATICCCCCCYQSMQQSATSNVLLPGVMLDTHPWPS